MSLLDPNSQIQPTKAEANALQIKQNTVNLANRIFKTWELNYDMIWNSGNPQGVLDELGTDGAEVFALSTQIIHLMESTMPEALPDDWGRILRKIESIPPYTLNEDGTVSLVVPEEQFTEEEFYTDYPES